MPIRGLVFSPFPIFPADAGNRVKLLAICKEFRKEGFDVDFLYYPREDGGEFSREEIMQHRSLFDCVFMADSRHPYPDFTRKHQTIEEIYHDGLGQYFQFIYNKIRYDFVYVNYAPFARLFDFCRPETVCILDTHDRLGDRRDFLEQQGLKPDFFSISVEDESRLLNSADLVLAIKDAEASYFRRNTLRRVVTVGAPTTALDVFDDGMRDVEGRPVTFGFLGSRNGVNYAALRALYDELVRQGDALKGKALFHLAGRMTERVPLPAALQGVDFIRVEAFVDSLDDFYLGCDVLLVPTLISTGLKMKAIEALTYDRPVIATADGFDGIESPYSYHGCQSMAEVVDFCRQVVDGHLPLPDMLDSTRDVSRNYLDNYERNLAVVLQACRPWKAAVVITPETDKVSLYTNIFSFQQLLRWRCEVTFVTSSPEDVPARFVKTLGAKVVSPAQAREEGTFFELLIHAAGEEEIVDLPPARMGFRAGIGRIGLVRSPTERPSELLTLDVLPFDQEAKHYWGPRLQLCFFASAGHDWSEIGAMLSSADFQLMRDDFSDVVVVDLGGDRRGIETLPKKVRVVAFADFLFDDHSRHARLLCGVGPLSRRDALALQAIAGLPNTSFLANGQAVVGAMKIMAGADIAVLTFSNVDQLRKRIAQRLFYALQYGRPKERYRVNGGAIDALVTRLKQELLLELGIIETQESLTLEALPAA